MRKNSGKRWNEIAWAGREADRIQEVEKKEENPKRREENRENESGR